VAAPGWQPVAGGSDEDLVDAPRGPLTSARPRSRRAAASIFRCDDGLMQPPALAEKPRAGGRSRPLESYRAEELCQQRLGVLGHLGDRGRQAAWPLITRSLILLSGPTRPKLR
jgi:hypothetical protein